jgi:hypothetical protein
MTHAERLRLEAAIQRATANCLDAIIETEAFKPRYEQKYLILMREHRERALAFQAGADALEEKERRDAQIG